MQVELKILVRASSLGGNCLISAKVQTEDGDCVHLCLTYLARTRTLICAAQSDNDLLLLKRGLTIDLQKSIEEMNCRVDAVHLTVDPLPMKV